MVYGDGFRGSNSVEIMNDSEPYEMARALDSDDDRPVGELTESDVEMLRRIFPGRRDPRVHEFSDLAHFDQACLHRRSTNRKNTAHGPTQRDSNKILVAYLHK